VIGDPLCAPFRQKPLTKGEIDAGIDDTTELPAILSQRKIAVLAATGVKADAATAFVKGNVRLDRNDRSGARQAFEQATKLDPAFWTAQFSLATLYESISEWDAAIDRYRTILARTPNNILALNNLAYVLAVRKNNAAEALPLAKRAHELAKNLPPIADTLAWVEHLAGDDAAAEPLLVDAARRMPNNADIRLHAAFVLAANGKSAQAASELAAAIKLNPELEQREEVRALRAQLAAPKFNQVLLSSSAESRPGRSLRSQKVPPQRTFAPAVSFVFCL
jgi:Tfp pilus assembly protein PilF